MFRAWFSTRISSSEGDIEGVPNLSVVDRLHIDFLMFSTSSLTSGVDRMPTPLEVQK